MSPRGEVGSPRTGAAAANGGGNNGNNPAVKGKPRDHTLNNRYLAAAASVRGKPADQGLRDAKRGILRF